MRKVILSTFLFCSLFTIAFPQTPDSTYAKWLLTPEIKRGFDYALSAAKLKYEDFTFRTDYWEIDSARLAKVNKLSTTALGLPFWTLELANKLQNGQKIGSFAPIVSPVRVARDLQLETGLYKREIVTFDDALMIWSDIQHRANELSKGIKNFPAVAQTQNVSFPKIEIHNILSPRKTPKSIKSSVLKEGYSILLATVDLSRAWSDSSIKYTRQEMNFIGKRFPSVILEDTSEQYLSVEELDSIQKVEEKITQEFVSLATPSRYNSMAESFISGFLNTATEASRLLKAVDTADSNTKKNIVREDKKYHAIIGGPGPNHYKGDYSLIIDLGGDDTYELSRRPNFENQIIIDLGGNDKYFTLEDYALACGYFGYSVLIDAAGDDLYQGKNFSVGCGFFGCGLLWDQAGNDTYIGDQFTQGAGGFGIGILKDDGGNDRYQAARASQGFGFVRGVGALLDAAGSDNYFAGGKYKELLGLSGEIRYMSESQGYATGLRPDLSGGMGFLFDYDGDDSYSVDMNGQGASYWWGLGALVDFKGNDRYLAQQYAQGAGVHMSLGCLVDSSGNDFYFSKGVSQGCGHDLGAGMLFDLSGNDNYVATDGSQAYGSANGFGILVDGQGKDGYYVKDKKTTQGVGNPRREYGSIAVFLDCGGIDHYDGNGGENRIWKPTGTIWGVGVDGEFGALDTAQVKK